jgi:hypothetical protein
MATPADAGRAGVVGVEGAVGRYGNHLLVAIPFIAEYVAVYLTYGIQLCFFVVSCYS